MLREIVDECDILCQRIVGLGNFFDPIGWVCQEWSGACSARGLRGLRAASARIGLIRKISI